MNGILTRRGGRGLAPQKLAHGLPGEQLYQGENSWIELSFVTHHSMNGIIFGISPVSYARAI